MDESKAQPDISPTEGADASDSAPRGAERIAKYLSRAGICSRRDAERLIADGKVRVNGVVIDTPVVLVTGADRIVVDGQQVDGPQEIRLFRYNKPAGLVTTNRDELGRDTIFDHLSPELPRLMTVGRLDINTEGLLLLTTDGELARQLELPSTGWTRRYKVRAFGELDEGKLAHIRRGVSIEGIDYAPAKVDVEREQGANMWLTIALTEGKNREVKKLLDYCGLRVNRLIRLSYGPFQLGTLPSGAVEEIKRHVLREQVPGFEDRLKEERAAKKDAAKDTRGRLADEHAKYTPPEGAKRKKVKAAAKPVRGKDDPRDTAERPRRAYGDAPRSARDGDDRPRGSYGDKPRYTRDGETPDRDGDRPKSARPAGDRPRFKRDDGDAARAPRKEWKPRGEGASGDRPARRFKEDDGKKPFGRPDGKKPFRRDRDAEGGADRPARSGRPYEKRDGDTPRGDKPRYGRDGGYGDKPRFSRDGDDRPRRSYGDKPRARHGEDGDSRPPRKEWKPRGEGDFGDRPARRFKDDDGKRPFGRSDGKKPFRRDRDAEGGADRPRSPRPARGDRPYEKRDGDAPRGDKPRYGRDGGYGDRPRFSRDGDAPAKRARPERTRPEHDGEDRPKRARPAGDRPRFKREDGDAPRALRDGGKPPSNKPKAKKPAKKAGIIKKPEPRTPVKKTAKPAPQRVPGNPIAGTLRINKPDGE